MYSDNSPSILKYARQIDSQQRRGLDLNSCGYIMLSLIL